MTGVQTCALPILRRHGLPTAPERKRTTSWAAFIRSHLALLAGTDFFTAEVLTLRGLGSVLNKDSLRTDDVIQASKRQGAWHGKGLLVERDGLGPH